MFICLIITIMTLPNIIALDKCSTYFVCFSPTVLSWMASRNFSTVIEVSDLSTTLSSAACSGLHAKLKQAKVNATLKPGSGGKSMLHNSTIFIEIVPC